MTMAMRDAGLQINGLRFDALTLEGAVCAIVRESLKREKLLAIPVNVDVLMLTEADPELKHICQNADFVFADGMPIVWLSRLLRQSLPERVTGADMLPEICKVAAESRRSVFFVGGLEGAAATAAQKLQSKFPGLQVCGTLCPPLGFEMSRIECEKLITTINAAKPDILFVGLGAPKQEKWLWQFRDELDFGVAICVGAAFDFQAGMVRRAPRIFGTCGCEWVWRLFQEPRRLWRRYILRDFKFFGVAMRAIKTSAAAKKMR
jgi:N-acetylglucosaminyldiphosphoundecaprenol N-acetyl-beta-D-mannosaminyltransferase